MPELFRTADDGVLFQDSVQDPSHYITYEDALKYNQQEDITTSPCSPKNHLNGPLKPISLQRRDLPDSSPSVTFTVPNSLNDSSRFDAMQEHTERLKIGIDLPFMPNLIDAIQYYCGHASGCNFISSDFFDPLLLSKQSSYDSQSSPLIYPPCIITQNPDEYKKLDGPFDSNESLSLDSIPKLISRSESMVSRVNSPASLSPLSTASLPSISSPSRSGVPSCHRENLPFPSSMIHTDGLESWIPFVVSRVSSKIVVGLSAFWDHPLQLSSLKALRFQAELCSHLSLPGFSLPLPPSFYFFSDIGEERNCDTRSHTTCTSDSLDLLNHFFIRSLNGILHDFPQLNISIELPAFPIPVYHHNLRDKRELANERNPPHPPTHPTNSTHPTKPTSPTHLCSSPLSSSTPSASSSSLLPVPTMSVDSWELYRKIRTICGNSPRLSVILRLENSHLSSLPLLPSLSSFSSLSFISSEESNGAKPMSELASKTTIVTDTDYISSFRGIFQPRVDSPTLAPNILFSRWLGENISGVALDISCFIGNQSGRPTLPCAFQQALFVLFEYTSHILLVDATQKHLDCLNELVAAINVRSDKVISKSENEKKTQVTELFSQLLCIPACLKSTDITILISTMMERLNPLTYSTAAIQSTSTSTPIPIPAPTLTSSSYLRSPPSSSSLSSSSFASSSTSNELTYACFDQLMYSFMATYLRVLHGHRRVPLTNSAVFESSFRDKLQIPLQPLGDHLEAATYEVFETDPVKYVQYERAIRAALIDWEALHPLQTQILDSSSSPSSSSSICIIMIVGAGRGPLVCSALTAAASLHLSSRTKIYALDKNPFAVNSLRFKQRTLWRGKDVTVIRSDMRDWVPPQKANIIVSELLGSFADNELSPECIDGAQMLLAPHGVCIPQRSLSYLAPVMAHHAWSSIAQMAMHSTQSNFCEMPFVVRLHRAFVLAPPAPCFSFTHPTFQRKRMQYDRADSTKNSVYYFPHEHDMVITPDTLPALRTTVSHQSESLFCNLSFFHDLMQKIDTKSQKKKDKNKDETDETDKTDETDDFQCSETKIPTFPYINRLKPHCSFSSDDISMEEYEEFSPSKLREKNHGQEIPTKSILNKTYHHSMDGKEFQKQSQNDVGVENWEFALPNVVDNTRECTLDFHSSISSTVHGFVGYFHSWLYKDISISTYPASFSYQMFSWFPMFFPLKNPLEVKAGERLQAHFSRCLDSQKVWYEWSASTSNQSSIIHNSKGHAYNIRL